MPLFRPSLACAVLLLSGCGTDTPESIIPAAVAASGEELDEVVAGLQAQPLVAATRLVIPTYDGSGQAVHPDVVRFAAPWHGWEYWMAFTPYPKSDQAMENPSLAVSHDGVRWEVPADLVNPLIAAPTEGYNSDPDLSYDAGLDRLVLIYRTVTGGENLIRTISSGDGRDWTLPRLAFRRKNHGIVSPTVASRPNAPPSVWYVDAGNRKCRARITRVLMQEGPGMHALEQAQPEVGWGATQSVGLVQPGFSVWHLDVIWVAERSEYWAIYPANRNFSCRGRELFFARSRDGISWTTYRTPVLRRRDADWMGASLYRGSLLYDAKRDVIRIYFSASAPGSIWQIGYMEYRVKDFLAGLENGAGAASVAMPRPAQNAEDATLEP
ncbi:MAG: hypothetical protein ABJC19_08215 [Gemmatimonadota bacterium]